MSLRDLSKTLRISYRSGQNDIIKDFYVPCLDCGTLYRRAVGYFTSYGLTHAARGIASLVSRKGRMQLVASPYLEESDVEAIRQATNKPDEVLRAIIARSFGEITDYIIRERLNALAWLVADGSLEVRLALRLNDKGELATGLYHEKIGIFSDAGGNHVAFAGSANETAGGLVDNFESIKVFWSWEDTQGRVLEEISNFESLWNNRTPGLRVVDFTDISNEFLSKFKLPHHPLSEEQLGFRYEDSSGRNSIGMIPPGLVLRDYQREAMRSWILAGGKGILAMATGAGKTITAMCLACKLLEKPENRPLVVIVVCPFLNLANQWIREMAIFGIDPVQCFESRQRWESDMQQAYQRLASQLTPVIGVVVTNKTFLTKAFQDSIKPSSALHMLIADEVHNLGASRLKDSLPDAIQLRLGLSATPERHNDAAGTEAIFEYFGKPVYEFSISDAIRKQVLVPYVYLPVLIDLTDSEASDYLEITQKISRIFPKDDSDVFSEVLKQLLIKRARIIGSASNKLPALRRIIQGLDEPLSRAIIYCGDGSVESPITAETERQITAVTRILGDELKLRTRRFTCDESADERDQIVSALRKGDLNAVVAIRCLDEGIDIPDARIGFLLASSTNPRQFVQRRGRLLRRSDSTGKRRAVIYDFIVKPPNYGSDICDDAFNLERRFFQRELERIVTFCESAENGPDALHCLEDLRRQYNLFAH